MDESASNSLDRWIAVLRRTCGCTAAAICSSLALIAYPVARVADTSPVFSRWYWLDYLLVVFSVAIGAKVVFLIAARLLLGLALQQRRLASGRRCGRDGTLSRRSSGE